MSVAALDEAFHIPIRSYNRIALDIDALRFGLLANAGKGRLVFLLLQRPSHLVIAQ